MFFSLKTMVANIYRLATFCRMGYCQLATILLPSLLIRMVCPHIPKSQKMDLYIGIVFVIKG